MSGEVVSNPQSAIRNPHFSLPAPGSHIHIIGIGGIGTSALARVLAKWGYRVTGSDAAASGVTAALQDEGIAVTIGHSAAAVAGADLVVYSAAVRDENGRTYAAATVELPSLRLTALEVCVAMAISAGSRGLEAAVVLTQALGGVAGLAAVRDFAGPGVPVHVGDHRGEVFDTTRT